MVTDSHWMDRPGGKQAKEVTGEGEVKTTFPDVSGFTKVKQLAADKLIQ